MQDIADILTCGAGLLQNKDAVLDGVGIIVHRQTKLSQGAEHTVAFLAAKLALFDLDATGKGTAVQGGGDPVTQADVLSARNDLHGGFFTHVHLADEQMVGIGMALNGHHVTCHYAYDILALLLKAFHLGAGHGHAVAVGFNIGVRLYEFGQPFHRTFHCFIPLP